MEQLLLKYGMNEGIHSAVCKATNTENGQSGEGEVKVYIKNIF